MAQSNPNLDDIFTDTANAIRAKTKKAELIHPVDFADEIESIKGDAYTKRGMVPLRGVSEYEGPYTVTENGTLPTSGKKMTSDLTVNVPSLKTLLDNTKSCYYLFRNYQGNNIADLISYDDTAEVTDMSNMFNGCAYITSVPLLNTSNVTNTGGMFYGCFRLTSIPLFDTSEVTDMASMFNNCYSLTTIPLLNTSKATNMGNMFGNCSLLTTIPLFNTGEVTNMNYMLYGCSKLTSVPLLDTSKVTSMGYMFSNCNHLTSIPALDVSKVTTFANAFNGCSALTEIKMTGMKVNFDISASTLFTREALVEIITNCATVTTTRTLTMGATNLAKLTQADIDLATSKGWTLK